MKITRPIIFCILFACVYFFPLVIYAAVPTLISYPSSVIADNSFSVSATMSGLSNNAVYRMRIAFAQSGTTNYFGSIYNGSSWYNGTPSPINYGNFLSITTDSNGGWFGNVQGRVELSDPNFKTGSGTYDFKLGRYTHNGTSATWSNPVSVGISAPPPTPTPTLAVKPTSTSTSLASSPTTSNSQAPDQSNSQSSDSTNTNSKNTNSSDTQVTSKSPTNTTDLAALPTSVLGIATKSADSSDSATVSSDLETPTTAKAPVKTLAATKNNLSKVLIGIGIIFLISCGILAFLSYKKRKNTQE